MARERRRRKVICICRARELASAAHDLRALIRLRPADEAPKVARLSEKPLQCFLRERSRRPNKFDYFTLFSQQWRRAFRFE